MGVLAGAGGSVAYAGSTASQVHTGSTPSAGPAEVGSALGGRAGGTPPPGGFAGLPSSSGASSSGATSSNSALIGLLSSSTTRWAAATVGSQSAAPLQLASGRAVMAIGGFTGSDDAPTPAQFQSWVQQGLIHYFVPGNGLGGGTGGGSSSGSEITSWVESHYTATTVGGARVYDLTSATS